ncbi:hypothetical protein BLNAU_12578 [Blattamonas nauphoetae]|uniref:Uncharacterized protein n=1 Tax=Blattamonas nauphoetae TaxID=2049346 RepID=A0ABQ9XM50_9EUKA|nr:hypothetical protein BLNAU_12578 [Blattamonas nauphoetae]
MAGSSAAIRRTALSASSGQLDTQPRSSNSTLAIFMILCRCIITLQVACQASPTASPDVCQHHHNRERNVSLLRTKHSCARSHHQKHHRASVSVDVIPLQTFCPSMNSSSSLFLRHSAPTFLQLSLSFILILPFSNNKAHLRHLNPTPERTSTSGSRLTCTSPHQQRHRSWKTWMSDLKSRRQPTSSSCRAAPHVEDKLSTVFRRTSPHRNQAVGKEHQIKSQSIRRCKLGHSFLQYLHDVLYSPTTAQVFVSGASCFLDGGFEADYKLSDMDLKFDLNSAMPPVPFSSGVGDMLLKSCKFERTCILNSALVCDPLIILDSIQPVTFQNGQFDDCVSSTLIEAVGTPNVSNLSINHFSTTTTLTVFIAVAECIAVQCGGSLDLKSVSMSGNGVSKGKFAPARKYIRCVSEGTANIASASGDGADAPLHWISGSESTIRKDDKTHASPLFVAELKNNESTSTLTKYGTTKFAWKWRLLFSYPKNQKKPTLASQQKPDNIQQDIKFKDEIMVADPTTAYFGKHNSDSHAGLERGKGRGRDKGGVREVGKEVEGEKSVEIK